MAEKAQTAIAQKTEFKDAMSKVGELFLPMVYDQLDKHGIRPDGYQRQCAMNALSTIYTMITDAGKKMADIDRSNLTQILEQVTSLRLNAHSVPREIYFQLRNKKVGNAWVSQVEMGIEGDGNDALLRNFGVDIKQVYSPWLIRQDDKFTYPKMKGLEMTPPEWEPCGKGKVIRVVYPIVKNDDIVEYLISEREDVRKNLYAHVLNNLMNETFGLAESRYNATADQKKKIDAKKDEIKALMDGKGVEEILDCKELEKWISPAWREAHSRESMIIRKMRNNAVKPAPKDFGSAYATSMYIEKSDESTALAMREMRENANKGPVIDAEYMEITDEPDEPEQPNMPEPTEPTSKPEPEAPADEAQTTLDGPGF